MSELTEKLRKDPLVQETKGVLIEAFYTANGQPAGVIFEDIVEKETPHE